MACRSCRYFRRRISNVCLRRCGIYLNISVLCPEKYYSITHHKTDKCALIWVKGCRYSVSDKHPRKNVIVRIGAFDVEIYELTGELICTHRRSYKQGSTTIDPTMYVEALAARPRARIKKSDNEYVNGESSNILHDKNGSKVSASCGTGGCADRIL